MSLFFLGLVMGVLGGGFLGWHWGAGIASRITELEKTVANSTVVKKL